MDNIQEESSVRFTLSFHARHDQMKRIYQNLIVPSTTTRIWKVTSTNFFIRDTLHLDSRTLKRFRGCVKMFIARFYYTGWSKKIETVFLNFKVICKKDLMSKLKISLGKIFIDKLKLQNAASLLSVSCLAFGRSMQRKKQLLKKIRHFEKNQKLFSIDRKSRNIIYLRT